MYENNYYTTWKTAMCIYNCFQKYIYSGRASLIAQLVKNPPAMQDTDLILGLGRSSGEDKRYSLLYSRASLVAHQVRNLPAMQRPGFYIPGQGRSPAGGHGNPLQQSCLENPHGQRSLAVYSPWGHKELDITE